MKNVKTEGIITKAVGGNYYVAVATAFYVVMQGVYSEKKKFLRVREIMSLSALRKMPFRLS